MVLVELEHLRKVVSRENQAWFRALVYRLEVVVHIAGYFGKAGVVENADLHQLDQCDWNSERLNIEMVDMVDLVHTAVDDSQLAAMHIALPLTALESS